MSGFLVKPGHLQYHAISLWILFKPSVSAEVGRTAFFLTGGGRSLGPYFLASLKPSKGRALITAGQGWEHQLPTPLLLMTPWLGWGGVLLLLPRRLLQKPHSGGCLTPEWLCKFRLSSKSSLTLSSRAGKGHPVIAGQGLESMLPVWPSLAFTVGVLLPWQVWKTQFPTWPSLKPPQQRGWSASTQPNEGGNLRSSFSAQWWWEKAVIFCDFGSGRIVVVYRPSVFLGFPFPGPLAWKSRLLLELFCLCPLMFLGCQLLQLQGSGIWSKKKIQTTHHLSSLGSQGPWLVYLLPTSSESLSFLTFVYKNVHKYVYMCICIYIYKF